MASRVLPIGPSFGRFVVARKLGQGAEGAVYLATDPRLGRQVALKTVPFDGRRIGDGVAALLDEARIVSTLSHPNIVPLYDASEQDGTAFLVFEYVEGQKLASLLAQQGGL